MFDKLVTKVVTKKLLITRRIAKVVIVQTCIFKTDGRLLNLVAVFTLRGL